MDALPQVDGSGQPVQSAPSVLVDPHKDPALFEAKRRVKSLVEKSFKDLANSEGVPQNIYLKFVKGELDNEAACLELPLTIILLLAFSMLAMTILRQGQVLSVESAIEFDIWENANFAWSGQMGEKGLADVNAFCDFWSWLRLGLVPLTLHPSWGYVEDYPAALGSFAHANTAYDKSVLPGQWQFGGQERASPVINDYLRYSRVIGGIRMQQERAEASFDACRFPLALDRKVMEDWFGKPCSPSLAAEMSIELQDAEAQEDNPWMTEWLLPEIDSGLAIRAQVLDMEDGCNYAAASGADMSTCRCVHCRPSDGGERQPWLDEQVVRVELTFVVYNVVYGLYSYVGINFFFNRGGEIKKFTNIMSVWADLSKESVGTIISFYGAASIWLFALFYVFIAEVKEMWTVVRTSTDRCYSAIWNDYLAPWNLVDWSSFGVGFMVAACYMRMFFDTGATNLQLQAMMQASLDASNASIDRAAYLVQLELFFAAVREMCASEKLFRQILCIYPFIVMVRLFKSFAAQPRLALVTATLERGAQDMLHFFIVFFSVYACMMVNSVLFFGQDIEEFSTLFRAAHTCFLAMFGDWDWEAMQEIGFMKACIWFWMFMLIMVLILLNMLLAIIMEAYNAVKAEAAEMDTLAQQTKLIYRRWRDFKAGKRVRLTDVLNYFEDEVEGDHKKMLASKRMITPDFLTQKVTNMKHTQALRTLTNSLQHHKRESSLGIPDQKVLDEIKANIEHVGAREGQIVDNTVYVKEMLSHYDRLEAPGDAEYEFYFPEGSATNQNNVENSRQVFEEAVTGVSSEVGGLFVEGMSRIERWQDSFERQQGELHRLIAEMQLMVAQQARCVASLTEAALHASQDQASS
jgi:hypothetical protein